MNYQKQQKTSQKSLTPAALLVPSLSLDPVSHPRTRWRCPGLVFCALGMSFLSVMAQAESHPLQGQPGITLARSKKTQHYLKEGAVVGGDQAIDEASIVNIRRAPNADFDRIVIDLEAFKQGESPAIQRPPFYQVAIEHALKKLTFTFWGRPSLKFNAHAVGQAFFNHGSVAFIELFPRLEELSWTFSLSLKEFSAVEVFELTHPLRIIADIHADIRRPHREKTVKTRHDSATTTDP